MATAGPAEPRNRVRRLHEFRGCNCRVPLCRRGRRRPAHDDRRRIRADDGLHAADGAAAGDAGDRRAGSVADAGLPSTAARPARPARVARSYGNLRRRAGFGGDAPRRGIGAHRKPALRLRRGQAGHPRTGSRRAGRQHHGHRGSQRIGQVLGGAAPAAPVRPAAGSHPAGRPRDRIDRRGDPARHAGRPRSPGDCAPARDDRRQHRSRVTGGDPGRDPVGGPRRAVGGARRRPSQRTRYVGR